MKTLRSYQREAVERIYKFFNSDLNKAKICMSTGLGKTAIIASAIDKILEKHDKEQKILIAVLTSQRAICEQIKNVLVETNPHFNIALYIKEMIGAKILITTYQDVRKNQLEIKNFDLIICDEAQFIKNENIFDLLSKKGTKFLGVVGEIDEINRWFGDATCIFSYLLSDAIRDGYVWNDNEKKFVENFLVPLLKYQGYTNIVKERRIFNKNRSITLDIVANKGNEIIAFEVKMYRNLYNSKSVLDNAVEQVLLYKHYLTQSNEREKVLFILVVPYEIDEKIQNEIYEQSNVIVWSINNLIYLCEEEKKLLDLLASYIPYSLLNLESRKPQEIERKKEPIIIKKEEHPSITEKYLRKLKKCKAGKKNGAAIDYEKICTEIIYYLFKTEFFKFSEQHHTDDEMFRMDLICSLKGTTEFWNFLITFYNTKFVVFEYKNYSKPISQNLIYITEKYLFSAALRNVAFIVSRKGFDKNAKKAALDCLKENGKLIISLNDEDLIKMVSMKENGEEPSDYLLDIIEDILMSVSK